MDSNIFQLTSSTLLQKIKVIAGQLGLGIDTFSTICGTISFPEKPDAQCNLGHWSFHPPDIHSVLRQSNTSHY